MLDNMQNRIDGIFAALLNVTAAGGVALFDASVIAALIVYIWLMIKALNSGGGAILETVAYRLFILFALTALVTSWPALGTAIRNDINGFAAHVSQTNALAPGDFTPSGIIATNQALTDAIYTSGQGGPFALLSIMGLWKVISIAFIQIGSLALALDLFLANISLDIVFASCAMLIGLVVSPWLSSFAMQYVGLIVGTAVYIILVGVFVAVGQAIATICVGTVHGLAPGTSLSGSDMLEIGVLSLGFAFLAWVVPAAVASRIAGGAPILQALNMLSAARQGKATIGL